MSITKHLTCLAALLLALLATAFSAGLAPEPAGIPKQWQLQVDFGPLRVWSTTTADGPKAYYYMTYKAVNRTGQDVIFAPSFELVNGDGRITRSGTGVSAEVTATLKERAGGTLVEDQITIIGTMLQGVENAKEGIVVWVCDDLTPGAVSVYAAGFSGETAQVKVPGKKDDKGRDVMATLRKTRELDYNDPGDLANRRDVPLDMTESKWVMR
jgi:hypothetical protein